MKKSKFEKIQTKCKYMSGCECGMTDLCDHEDNPDGFCEEENCPKPNKRK